MSEQKTKVLPDGRTAYWKDGRWLVPVDKNRYGEMKTAREVGKIGNFSVLYGSGEKGLKGQIAKFYPDLPDRTLSRFAREAILAKKGEEFDGVYVGGTDSGAFNLMEEIALKTKVPQLPCLGTKISTALRPDAVGTDFKTGRVNWTIQSSGAEVLSIFLTAIHWLSREFKIPFRFVLSIHDELWCITPADKAEEFAVLFQMAHLYTWALFHHRLGMEELPLNRAFFSGVAIDERLRKSVTESTVSPSNPGGDKEPAGKEFNMVELAETGAIKKLTTRKKLIDKGLL
jgi:DNA polymerase gamma 1